MKAMTLLAVAQQLAGIQIDPDALTFPRDLTCREIWGAESAAGGKPLYDGPYDPHRALVVTRTYLGFDATVIYLCNSERLDWRITTVALNSLDNVRQLVTQHRQRMNEQFGAPCWHPSQLSEQQRALLPDGVPMAHLLGRRVVWNIGPGLVSGITMPDAPVDGGSWRVVIDAGLPSEQVSQADAVGQAWKLSSCAKAGVQ
jgi:hypothetical protein